jgi:hypothetical protein
VKEFGKGSWTGHVAGMAQNENAYRDLVRNPKGKNLLGIPDTDGGIILKWTLNK